MEEVKIWNYVIKWGISKNSSLPSDPEDWSRENFIALKTALQNYLPHIRYFQMPGKVIINNLQPYQKILEKNPWKDIMKKYMTDEPISSAVLPPRIISKPTLPNRIVEQFSNSINEAHAAEITSWVDMKDNLYSVTNNPYDFKLLLRGSRLVICTDEILGGYNPIGWDKQYDGKYMNCKESFIFTLKNGSIQNSILSHNNCWAGDTRCLK
ncbi:hypothetical protein C2G38_2182885 [Gigaspora rosea]|uniref:TLDc domain-containing protein n=1 Tax=Gigaspora rosea TaxID=44941 RepID=A0A397VBI6_9GLOM|nr:hypothetical protein C2G38_2182885 [Gigaspora rosea]